MNTRIKAMMTRVSNWCNTFSNWCNTHTPDMVRVMRDLGRGFDRLTRNIVRLMILGVLVNIVASHFYPEFPERFPIIYGWFDGWLQFGEFAVKAGLGAVYAFFTGNLSEFWAEYTSAFNELLKQFVNWLSIIRF